MYDFEMLEYYIKSTHSVFVGLLTKTRNNGILRAPLFFLKLTTMQTFLIFKIVCGQSHHNNQSYMTNGYACMTGIRIKLQHGHKK